MPQHEKPVRVLLVEDNLADVRLTMEAMAEADFSTEMHVVSDGVEAIRFLRGRAPFLSAGPPDLIILDLNLPRMDGREVLAEIKADAQLRHIPVIVLTTSEAQSDVIRSYQLHASCYITKPISLERFLEVIRSIQSFWLSIVTFPSNIDREEQAA